MVSVKGIVCPCNWDAQGKVMNVLVAADGEKDYYVESTPLGAELARFLGRRIMVEGILKSEAPKTTLEVTSYKLATM